MGEGLGDGGIGEVVGRHVDRLDRGDRGALDRGDALLELGDLGRQRRLVADARRQAAEQARDLAARLDEAEDVVDQQQHVLMLRRRGNARRSPAPSCRRASARPAARSSGRRPARCGRSTPEPLQLQPQLVALARALADAGEDRDARRISPTVVRIISMISTVLPTPAPPNIAALPPRASGASRSITLMPVRNSSRSPLWSRAGRGAVDRCARHVGGEGAGRGRSGRRPR